ncbi:nuclear transport factor 2 family protein [Nocardia cyriacigeorgica]|uniref:Nuclear transport factor 2 family protein n=2 Tax=Nocardia cyriacigeorgica TaxID=135487 RepID=A0A6P1DFA1_9NOCA|nr:nuclear transport factor 2 family protein [Nocardia cyriacigeorgica]NEW40191.1 nuclear transport factor 2 family protein [Nocardia cyriacigeorgica]NEW47273.1 nuclear transport factor 2 family protein [Nocardia cyriacigeorgica]NEW51792.1 nuclear transport factor 2 family protein [Nocardia cyriacigeorgica]NEW59025.1 nuclear transport factor 2 family protein [Nocardia cyriacigeorgica]
MGSAIASTIVARFCDATIANDVDTMMESLAPDAEFVSPLSGRMIFRGHDDLRVLLTAIFGGISELHWHTITTNGSTAVALADARIGRIAFTDAMVVDLDPSGRIRRLTPHLRPWLALTRIALAVGPALSRHPAIIRRALQARRH